ncbi:ATP-binding protein [Nocardia aurantia]|uniref:Uncharacterized protein n=1 Tax=Nocardia aurantia TaxID=2585199 RepID=A0A7K0DNZ4_9NOCA|nr:hypothetical protein [Nocardia aurantia]MQY27102.1 hypothetical protein [Nocardia aurantia]
MQFTRDERVLLIGLHPQSIDYSKLPGLDADIMTARVEAGNAALRKAGFDVVSCLLDGSPDDAETQLRKQAATERFNLVMIGAGIRAIPDYTLLFERIVNVLTEVAPGIRFCFNTSPETTINALERWISP